MLKRSEIKIYGQVHGIGFRFCAYQKFDELGLTGKASNEQDGSIKLEAQGEDFRLDELVKWCHVGPQGAKVSNVEVSDKPLEPEEKSQN